MYLSLSDKKALSILYLNLSEKVLSIIYRSLFEQKFCPLCTSASQSVLSIKYLSYCRVVLLFLVCVCGVDLM